MHRKSLFLGPLLAALLGACGVPESVDAPAGAVVGTTVAGVSRFLGIPYAEPPVGPRRFQPPIEHARWTTPLQATQVGPACPQGQIGTGEAPKYDEDCLRLNVWTPRPEGTLFTIGVSLPARADFERMVRAAFPAHADEVLALYPQSRYPDPKTALTTLLGDYAFVCHGRLQARLFSAFQPRTYFYSFTRANLTTALLGLGVTHGLELPFVFHNFPRPFAGDLIDEAVSDTIIGYWTRFARTGDPNGGGAPSWPLVTPANDYLQLDALPQAGKGLKREVCDVMEPWMLEP